MAGGLSGCVRGAGAGLYGLAWEWRRRAYELGWGRAQDAGARVVSVGNLTVGGTGKTTLTLWLARRARQRPAGRFAGRGRSRPRDGRACVGE